MTTPASAPVSEIGYQQPYGSQWWLYENETTPELQWPQSVWVYDQMRRQDAQVGSVLEAVTRPVLRTPWRIDPAGARDEVVQFVADDLGLPIVGHTPEPPPRTRDKFSWTDHLAEALLMLPIGFSYFEQVYRVTEDGSRAHLRKLALRPARTIEYVNVAEDGGLISIQQYWVNQDARPRQIPVNRLVAYVFRKEGGNWLGTSVLRQCYKNWLLKDRLLRVDAQTIERNGMGVPLYTGQEGASSSDLATGLAMAKAWRSGEAAGSSIPNGAKLELIGVQGTLPQALPSVRYHDEQIARAVLAHFLNLGTQTGSWALGTTFAEFFTLSLQTLAQQVADVATMHIVEDLVDVNWGEEEPAPRVVFDEIGSRQEATAQAISTLVQAGVIQPDEVLEASSRQQYGLPPKEPETSRNPDGTPLNGETPPGDTGAPASAPPPPDNQEWVAASADDDVDMGTALIVALAEFCGEIHASLGVDHNPEFNAKHPRGAHGRFRNVVGRIMRALEDWARGTGPDDPLPESQFTREHVRQAALHRGISLRRGASRGDIVDALLNDVREKTRSQREVPKPRAKFTLQGQSYGGMDVAVYKDADGRPRLFETNDRNQRLGLVAKFDDLADLQKWAKNNGETRLAAWAGRERKKVPSAPVLGHYTPAEVEALGKTLDMTDAANHKVVVAEARRRVEEVLDEVDQMVADGGSNRALLARLEARGKTGAPKAVVAELTAAVESGDRTRVREVTADLRKRIDAAPAKAVRKGVPKPEVGDTIVWNDLSGGDEPARGRVVKANSYSVYVEWKPGRKLERIPLTTLRDDPKLELEKASPEAPRLPSGGGPDTPGGGADDLDDYVTSGLAQVARDNGIAGIPASPTEADRAAILAKLRAAGITRYPGDEPLSGIPSGPRQLDADDLKILRLAESGVAKRGAYSPSGARHDGRLDTLRREGYVSARGGGGNYFLTEKGRAALGLPPESDTPGGDLPSAPSRAPGRKAAPRKAVRTALPSGADIEKVDKLADLSPTDIAQGHMLTPAGRRALDSLGPAGHPRIAAIPDTEGKIREAYRMLALPGQGFDNHVALLDVRKLIGDQASRSDVDGALRRMFTMPDVRLSPQSYARENHAERVPAAFIIGGQQNDMLHIDDPTLARPSQFSAVDMAQELVNRRSRGSRNPMMANLSDADLRAEVDRRIARDQIVARDVASEVPGYGGAPRKAAKKASPAVANRGQPNELAAPPAHAGTSVQRRVDDPAGTPGLFTIVPDGERGASGDGYVTLPDDTEGPWGHYGAAGVLLRATGDDGQTRYLLVQRGRRLDNGGQWQFPGGARDEHETPEQGAARELVEELGVDPSAIGLARSHGTFEQTLPGGWSYTSIAATVPRQFKPDLSGRRRRETAAAKWLTMDEIDQLDRDGKLLRPLSGGALQRNVIALFPADQRVDDAIHREDLAARLAELGRRAPADAGPVDRAAQLLAKGTDRKTVALALRRDAAGLADEVDAETLRLLAADLAKKVPVPPPYLNDRGNIDLAKLAELNGVNLDRWMPAAERPSMHAGPGHGVLRREFDEQYPFHRAFQYLGEALADPRPNDPRAKIVARMRDAAQRFRETRAEGIKGRGPLWFDSRSKLERETYIANAEAAARDMERLADLAEKAKVPPKPRPKTLGGTTLGAVVPVDESRFTAGDVKAMLRHRGEAIPDSFQHRSTGTAAALATDAPQRPGLTAAENRALDLYTIGAVADGLNGSLRRGRNVHTSVDAGPVGRVDLNAVQLGLDTAIESSTLDRDTVLWRGATPSKADFNRLVPGAVYSDLGYLSTSTDESGARRTIHWRRQRGDVPASRKAVLFKILAPAGTNAALGHERVSEVLLPRRQDLRVVRVDNTGDLPVVVFEAIPKPRHTDSVRGRDLSSEFDFDSAVRRAPKGGWTNMGDATGDQWLAEIQRMQGFDGKPRLVSREEMDRMVAAGEGTELFRGIGGRPKDARARVEQFRTGDLYAGNPGLFGSGTYSSPKRSTAAGYAAGDERAVLRMMLRRDARVIKYEDVAKLRTQLGINTTTGAELGRQREAELAKADPANVQAIAEIIERYERLTERQSARSRITADNGRLAALLGYDVMIGDHLGVGGQKTQLEPEYVILNRTALVVEEGQE